jgi:chemotaxis protein CheY-P-specific phosphatase CheC
VSERGLLSPLMLSSSQVEALRQLAGVASTDAARSLGRLLGTSVDADLPKAQVAPRGGVARVLQPDGPSFAVHFTVDGGARLRWLIHFTEQGATLMGGLLLGQPVLEPLGSRVPMYTSALAEAANIVVSSYVGGVGAAVGVTLVPSIPHVEVGPLERALNACFGDLDSALLLVTDLRLPGVRSAGRIVAAPEEESLSRLLKLLGAA